MTWCEKRRWHGQERFPLPSRFLSELPPECVQEVRPQALVRPATALRGGFGAGSRSGAAQKVGDPPFSIGDRVAHDRFGEGIVVGLEGDGTQARVQVHFDEHGSKWLMLAIAKLEKLK